MKKTLALVFALLMCVSVLVACGGSDNKLEGTWVGEEDGMTVEMTFKADGKLSMSSMGITMEGTYTVNGDKMTASASLMGMTEELFKDATWKIEGDKLTIDDGEEPVTLTRKK